eukprot:CAMPEP_0194487622 /NCGR_PEP_ID=MMETSP0253-20130528/7848_1 /TAXON_ID=2966 /ORGANISM="Noctiluca scintillans" /LENGTH=623 /DNA_ID=CAMNT_0039327873 /DNA_START=30 /DNA_END=1901 /DNA_ORIENTATION=-
MEREPTSPRVSCANGARSPKVKGPQAPHARVCEPLSPRAVGQRKGVNASQGTPQTPRAVGLEPLSPRALGQRAGASASAPLGTPQTPKAGGTREPRTPRVGGQSMPSMSPFSQRVPESPKVSGGRETLSPKAGGPRRLHSPVLPESPTLPGGREPLSPRAGGMQVSHSPSFGFGPNVSPDSPRLSGRREPSSPAAGEAQRSCSTSAAQRLPDSPKQRGREPLRSKAGTKADREPLSSREGGPRAPHSTNTLNVAGLKEELASKTNTAMSSTTEGAKSPRNGHRVTESAKENTYGDKGDRRLGSPTQMDYQSERRHPELDEGVRKEKEKGKEKESLGRDLSSRSQDTAEEDRPSRPLRRCKVGVSTIPGRKPAVPTWINQDATLTKDLPGGRLMACVFDGHGEQGHQAAGRAKALFEQWGPSLLRVADAESFKKLFLKVDAAMAKESWCGLAGTTAACAIVDPARETVIFAHVGDSQLRLLRHGRVVHTSAPHKFDEATKRRVESMGGEIRFAEGGHRIFVRGTQRPGLACSRSLGDAVLGRVGVIAEPDVSQEMPFGPGSAVIIASDGVWDMVPNPCAPAKSLADAQNFAMSVTKMARSRWEVFPSTDDISAVIVSAPEGEAP